MIFSITSTFSTKSKITYTLKRHSILLLSSIIIFSTYIAFHIINARKSWEYAYSYYLMGNYSLSTKLYKEVANNLESTAFLYNYANFEYRKGNIRIALKILSKIKTIDYDIVLLNAELLYLNHQYNDAEYFYILAEKNVPKQVFTITGTLQNL